MGTTIELRQQAVLEALEALRSSGIVEELARSASWTKIQCPDCGLRILDVKNEIVYGQVTIERQCKRCDKKRVRIVIGVPVK